ncbi:YncE family protein [Marivirga arenosa]|uniref:YncE family protein n=1 Tax=Marivirga arenosa TaxID=3059076 RepID=A0AA49GCE7_9BACT|nr:hypothetical protein [Marivirga sp. BKB1-2]WKK81642.2 hypothetical protein QYS47_05050 [Marivirga sp. BKB1-2]
MNQKHIYTLAIISLSLFLTACGDPEEVQLKTEGVYIYHEGGFGSNNATIGTYNPENYEYNPDLYRGQNGGFIGDVQQNILVDGNNDRIYSVLNGSNAIDLMTLNLKSEDKIRFAQLDKPRDIAVNGNLAFISNWGPYNENFTLTNSEIFVVDLNTNELIESIPVQEYPEHLYIQNNRLIVGHSNFDGSISEISIINIDNLEIENTIEMPAGPMEIIEDQNNNVWIVCTSGSIVKLSTSLSGIANQIDHENGILGDIDYFEGSIYFFSNDEIFSLNTSDNNVSSTGINVEMETPYAFAVDPASGDFYLGDALDYASEGLVLRYSFNGELEDTFQSGIIPTQFSFNVGRK